MEKKTFLIPAKEQILTFIPDNLEVKAICPSQEFNPDEYFTPEVAAEFKKEVIDLFYRYFEEQNK